MKFTCDQCQAQYMISDDKVGPKGVKVRCKKCGNIITVKHVDGAEPQAAGDTGAAAPAPAGGFDDAFSGGGASAGDDDSYERAPTKVFTTADLQRVRDEQLRAAPAAPAQAASGGLAATATAAAPEAASEEKVEWYVAINDDQVGPIGRADLQARWDKGEVRRDTLAWKQGLADWQAVQAIDELGWLTQRPQAVAAATASASAAKSNEVAKSEPAKAAEPEKPAVTWRPSGASALAALAKEAVEEPKKEAPAPSPLGDFTPHAPTDPFGGIPSFNQGPSTMWSMPQAPRKSGGGTKWIIAALVLVIVAVGGVALYALGYIGPRPPPVIVQQPVQPPPVAAVPVPGGQVPGQPGVAGQVPGQPAPGQPGAVPQPGQPGYVPPTGTPPVGGYPPPGQQPAGGGRKHGVKTAGGTGGETPSKPEGAPSKPNKPAGGGMDDLFNSKPASTAKATLDRNDVLSVVRGAIPALKSCVEKYNSGGGKTLPPKLILKFVIVPSGNSSAQEMASPELKGTSVDGCVVSIIRGMKFPEYQSGNIPVTFPIPLGG
jgi:predicted Zn finger-like uncharacterized protein